MTFRRWASNSAIRIYAEKYWHFIWKICKKCVTLQIGLHVMRACVLRAYVVCDLSPIGLVADNKADKLKIKT